MMKQLFKFPIYLFLSFACVGSYKLYWPQTYKVNNGELSYWSSMEMEGMQVAATYNRPNVEFKQSWASRGTDYNHWSLYNVFLSKYFSVFKQKIEEVFKNPKVQDLIPELKTQSIPPTFTVQCQAECPLSLNKTYEFSYKLSFNNTYEVRFDFIRHEWVGEDNPKVKVVIELLQQDTDTKNLLTQHVRILCVQLSNLFLKAGIDVFSREVQPKVFINSYPKGSKTEILCMVTGFYPKPIKVSLWKENKIENVLSTDTLPNGDGTYQITVAATVNVSEERSVYCQVEHSSYDSPLIVHYAKRESHWAALWAVSIGVPAVLCTVALAYFIKKNKR